MARTECGLNALKNGVFCVIPAVHRGHWEDVTALAHRAGDAYALGIHPLYALSADVADATALGAALQQAQADPRWLAVGEIGLDAFVPQLRTPPAWDHQRRLFVAQLQQARDAHAPVIVHSRRAVDAVLAALRSVAGRGQRWRGILHAFNGSLQQAHAALDLGLKLGFGGACTHERALQLRRLVAQLPLDALVLETDAPDIPPAWLYVPQAARAAGQAVPPNTPAQLPRIAAVVAALRGMAVDDLAAATVRNAVDALPKLDGLLNPPAAREQPGP